MVELARLESVCAGNRTVGSNPTLSAMGPHYVVYILHSASLDRTYTGYTNNINRRLKQHNAGKTFSTKAGCPWKLVYVEACTNREEARQREKWFKSSTGRRKIAEIVRDGKQIA